MCGKARSEVVQVEVWELENSFDGISWLPLRFVPKAAESAPLETPSHSWHPNLSRLRDAPAFRGLLVIEAYHMKPATFSAWWDIPRAKNYHWLWERRGKVKKGISCCRCLWRR
jgi:hypothetical protein